MWFPDPRKTAMPKTPETAPHVPSEKAPLRTEQLVHLAYILREQKVQLDTQIGEVEAALIERGAGKHTGDNPDQVVTVLAAIPGQAGKVGYTLIVEPVKGEAAAAFLARQNQLEAKARELAGDEFGNLFDRRVIYAPCAGFDAVAPKLLTPAKSRDLLELCAREGKPYAGQKAQVRYA